MNILEIAREVGVKVKKVSSAKGGEYSSPCPICGGEDRFCIWPEQGKWWCRGCDKKGDDIQLLIEAKGMSFPEACRYLGREVRNKRKVRRPVLPNNEKPEWSVREITEPVGEWKIKAEAFIGWAHRYLLKNQEELKWLKARGITEKTVRRFRLGWNPEDIYRSRSSWGLPESKDNKRRLWLPKGLAIPWSIDSKIHRLRIRRPDEDIRSDGDIRYCVISGSGMAPMVIVGETERACIVVESELDAILIAQEAGDAVSVVALGNSSSRPDKIAKALLSSADHIMVALDFDEAGTKAWWKWKEQYLQAKRWPVPEGGDPGEYFKAGGDIREWILAGLPPGLKPILSEKIVKSDVDYSNNYSVKVETKEESIAKESKLPNGYISKDRPCISCGKNLTLLIFPGQSARIPCYECAERYHEGLTRKSA